MCTLTYRLSEFGYELFFNRDEQRTRAQALLPSLDNGLKAIYPVDPIGKGTWLAVHESGLSLALLNFYQAEKIASVGLFSSRGEIILSLLKNASNVLDAIKSLPLKNYQAFQLCVFLPEFSVKKNKMHCFQWNGLSLEEVENNQPITSSGIEYDRVYAARKIAFKDLVDAVNPSTEAFINYHQWQQENGTLSVKMSREDAQTVSFSHITVNKTATNDANPQISFRYVDYLNGQQDLRLINPL